MHYFLGNENTKFPPPNSDTTVDNQLNPTIFVIYHDAQAYPEYLLTYE
jgi:poly [ADP-ribose] polymerase 10/14/15